MTSPGTKRQTSPSQPACYLARRTDRLRLGWAVLAVLLTAVRAAATDSTTRPAGPDDKSPAPATRPAADEAFEREVVGFTLRGPRRGQKAAILDMDSLVTPSGSRRIPLLRILERLGVKVTRTEREISFAVYGEGAASVDLSSGVIRQNGQSTPASIIVTASEVTEKQDVFLDLAAVSQILGVKLIWSEADYEIRGKTRKTLKIWKGRKLPSLLGVSTEDAGPGLPEVHDEAKADEDGVDFVKLEGNASYRVRSAKDRSSVHSGSVSGLSQTIWGGLAGGGYKAKLSEPSYLLDAYGGGFEDAQDAVKVDWLQWSKQFDNFELAIGDSVFGLNDITMPTIRMTGVRVNGFLGRDNSRDSASRDYGLRPYFLQPHVFEGHARAGSTVELFINDRKIDTREVLPDSPTRPGFGSYVFEDIDMVPGVLNEIRIEITDPDGFTSTLEKEIMGCATLLGRGETAYLGAVGTKRRASRFQADGGMFVGRVLHGLAPNVTLGGSVAAYSGVWAEYLEGKHRRSGRQYPTSGANVGAQVSWLAMDRVILSADFAGSIGGGQGQYDGAAVKLKADICPIRNLTIRSQLFSFSPDFFDGTNPDLHDRRGATVAGNWRITKKWRARASAGVVWDNLDGRQSRTSRVNYQGLAVSTTAIPKTSLSLEANRLDQNWAPNPLNIYRVKVRTTPFRNLTLMADASAGDALSMGDHSDFLSGLKLPGIVTGRQPTVTLTARKSISNRQSAGVSYRANKSESRHSVFHSYRTVGDRSLQIRTELGWDTDLDANRRDAFFENRCEYLLDRGGRNRIGLQTRYEREEWSAIAYVNLSTLIGFDRMRPKKVTNWRINPDRGAIHGSVFADYNANAVRDEGEPGVADVKVMMDTVAEDVSDKDGRFLLAVIGRSRTVRVSLERDTVPADFSVVHGTQLVRVTPNRLTRVDFAIAPFIAVTGKIVCVHSDGEKPLVGVRVFLVDPGGKVLVDSITAGDGSYYLGDARPGRFTLKIDGKTVPDHYGLTEMQRKITVKARKEFTEVAIPPFVAKRLPEDSQSKARKSGGDGDK